MENFFIFSEVLISDNLYFAFFFGQHHEILSKIYCLSCLMSQIISLNL